MIIEKPVSSFRTTVIEMLSCIASLYFDSLTISTLSVILAYKFFVGPNGKFLVDYRLH